jgi:hypothetical protein
MEMESDAADHREKLLNTPDDELEQVSFSMPWQIFDTNPQFDADGAPIRNPKSSSMSTENLSREELQVACWEKFNANPQTNTAVRGVVGRICGLGFEATSEIPEIQAVIEEIELDPRNRMYNYWPKYVGRAMIEGELFLIATCHRDGFVEIDFLDPENVSNKGDDDTGIIFHPKKKLLPIFYNISDDPGGQLVDQIPSIFVARYPSLVADASSHNDYDRSLQQSSRSRAHVFRKTGGYNRFVIGWDRGFCTRRTVSYLRTTLEWLNHYENLKKYEIDHKKSSGAYAWVFSFEDVKSFKRWLMMSDSDRAKTGIMATIVPGSRLILPPGMKIEAKNPQLTNISESDTDILQMASSGLNEPMDVMQGSLNSTFASAKASRGPMSDRTSDEIAYFDRFYKYDFWGSIFFLKQIVAKFPKTFSSEEAYAFKNGKPQFKTMQRPPERLVEICYPISETIDLAERVRAVSGVKHGPLSESVGIPQSTAAKKIGFGGYGYGRLKKATEDKKYPPLVYTVDAESLQETKEGEPKKDDTKKAEPKKGSDGKSK